MQPNIWFTSDTHFGHKLLLPPRSVAAARPFATVDEHDEYLIEQWNARVGKNDHVYHLGDFSFRNRQGTLDILYALNGRIFLIQGNHDRISPDVEKCFQWVRHYHEFKYGARRTVLSHYPFDTWNRSHYGQWHLHGHSHGSLMTIRGGRMDVGVDTNKLKPYAWEEIETLLAPQQYIAVDHHAP